MNNGTYILSAARTPIGKMMGGLATVTAPELGATAIRAALERAHVDASAVDEVTVNEAPPRAELGNAAPIGTVALPLPLS